MEQFITRGEEARFNQEFDSALRWYQRANVFAPQAGIPWYYAGLAYEASQRNEQAIAAYQQGIMLDPNFHNGWYRFPVRADRLFRQHRWVGAYPFYQQALQQPGQSAAFKFRAALAASAANDAPRDLLRQMGVPIHQIDAPTTIQGESMHWLEALNQVMVDGSRTATREHNGATTSPLWWSGAIAAVVEVPADSYEVTVRAASTPGASAELVVESDGVAIGTFETALDGSYGEGRFKLDWTGGTHVVTVRFTNNGVFNGIDNNAFIDWVRIAR
jgi:hypothetical protein